MANMSVRGLKARLSAVIARAEAGETIIVTKRNEPVAELRPIARRRTQQVLGQRVAGLEVGDDFFDPLPGDIIAGFEGIRDSGAR
jgi:prevent-host-death family protein